MIRAHIDFALMALFCLGFYGAKVPLPVLPVLRVLRVLRVGWWLLVVLPIRLFLLLLRLIPIFGENHFGAYMR
jgi:hypothetical protein